MNTRTAKGHQVRHPPSPHLVVGVVAATAELVPALGAAEVHAAAFGQRILKPAVRTRCKRERMGGHQGQPTPASFSDDYYICISVKSSSTVVILKAILAPCGLSLSSHNISIIYHISY